MTGKPHVPGITLRPVHACNYNCMGCVTHSPTSVEKLRGATDPVEENLTALAQSVASIKLISVAGGEPTLVGLPKLNAYIERCLDILDAGGVAVEQTEIITNGELFAVDPLLYTELTDRVQIVTLSVHPRLLLKFDNEYPRLFSYANLLRQIAPDRQIRLRMPAEFLDYTWTPQRKAEPASECLWGYSNICINVDADGVHKCGITAPMTQRSNRFATNNASQIVQASAVTNITTESVTKLLSGPVEACHHCPGTQGRKIPHLPGIHGDGGEKWVEPVFTKFDGHDTDILIPYRKDSELRERNLIRVIRYLYASVENPNIIVCESGPEDTLPDQLKRYVKHIYLYDPEKFSLARTFNTGVMWTRRPYILLQDADMMFYPGALITARETVDGREQPAIVIPQNSLVNLPESFTEQYMLPYSTDYQAHDMYEGRFDNPDLTGGFYGKRSAFEQSGGFDGSFSGWGFEDVDFVRRSIANGVQMLKIQGHSIHMDHPQSLEHRSPEQFQANLQKFNEREMARVMGGRLP